VRLTGYGQVKVRANGQLLTPTDEAKLEIGQFKEFPLTASLIKDGKVVLTFDPPTDEAHLNWRQQSRLSEVWLLKEP
jgi:hypothetical protein